MPSFSISTTKLWRIKKPRPRTRPLTSLFRGSATYIHIFASPLSSINTKNTTKPTHIRYSCSIPASLTATPTSYSTVSPTNMCIVRPSFSTSEINTSWQTSNIYTNFTTRKLTVRSTPRSMRQISKPTPSALKLTSMFSLMKS